MKLVVIESPFAGDVEANGDVKANIAYTKRCVRDCLLRGESPLASHLLFTQPGILRDEVPSERELGIAAGHAWIPKADLVAVYEDRGISKGMWQGIYCAHKFNIPVEHRRID